MSIRTDTLFPYTTLFRSAENGHVAMDPAADGFAAIASADSVGRILDQCEAVMSCKLVQAPHIAWLTAPMYGNDDFWHLRSEEHTSELQSIMRTSYAVYCLKKKIYTIAI